MEFVADVYSMLGMHEEAEVLSSGDLQQKDQMVKRLLQNDPQYLRRYEDIMLLYGLLKDGNTKEQATLIRRMLQDVGTDVNQNDEDPCGNGDQSLISNYLDADQTLQIVRVTMDFLHTRTDGIKSAFANACVYGDVHEVQKTLLSISDGLDPPFCRQHEYQALLETRETPMRMSPLLMVVSLATDWCPNQNYARPLATRYLLPKIAKMLLLAGASPECKDVLGKTVVHHGAGCPAGKTSLEMVDMCIAAAKTSYLYGKDVVLEGLNADYMNGKVGVVGGYDVDSDRRSVYIPELKKEVLIKPEKIRLLDGKEREDKPNLVDVPDRLGKVPLLHILQQDGWALERDDVAEYLIGKHGASIHAKDESGKGVSPAEFTLGWTNGNGSKVATKIAAMARADAKMVRDEKEMAGNICANCDESLGQGGSKCAACKVTFYCSRHCQVHHWKHGGHKDECKEIIAIAAGVKLSSEHVVDEVNKVSLGTSLILNSDVFAHRYQKPDGVAVEEKFVVAVKGFEDDFPLVICDKSQMCKFQYKPTGPGHAQIWKVVQKEPTWDGKKTFMKASFDEAGECTLYLSTACVKNKYAW